MNFGIIGYGNLGKALVRGLHSGILLNRRLKVQLLFPYTVIDAAGGFQLL